jgi:glycosyltransferase involved in cell wall biosynthesis
MNKKIYYYTARQMHNIHKQEAKCSPEGFEYVASNPALFQTIGVNKRKGKSLLGTISGWIYAKVVKFLIKLAVPKVEYARNLPAGIDMIHSGHFPLLNRKIPWMMEMEQVTQLTWYNRSAFDKKRNQRYFERMFKRSSCRGILAWTEAAKRSVLSGLNCKGFEDKIHVVPLTMEARKNQIKRDFKKNRVNLLFLSTVFDHKGGMEVLLATELLAKSYDVHLAMASKVPVDIAKRFEDNPNIHIKEPSSRDELIQMYEEADIFVMPGHFEAYGFVYLEAFSFGLPCIAAGGYAAEDIIEDGVRGKVIPNYLSLFDENYISTLKSDQHREELTRKTLSPPVDYVQRLAKAIEELIINPKLREEMSYNAYESIQSGKFSQAHRRKLLKEIYNKALS